MDNKYSIAIQPHLAQVMLYGRTYDRNDTLFYYEYSANEFYLYHMHSIQKYIYFGDKFFNAFDTEKWSCSMIFVKIYQFKNKFFKVMHKMPQTQFCAQKPEK